MSGLGKDGHWGITVSASNSHWEVLSLPSDLNSSVLCSFPAHLGTPTPSRGPCLLSMVTSLSSVQEPAVAFTSVHSLGGSKSEELEDTGPTKAGNRKQPRIETAKHFLCRDTSTVRSL